MEKGKRLKGISFVLMFIMVLQLMIPANFAYGEEGIIVTYDPDDNITEYQDFYKTTVKVGEKITDKPSDPERDGYLFKGWAYAFDAYDEPLLWDFDERAVTEDENLTLWAVWEKGVLVVYDPDDGKTMYPNFYKTTVKIGEKITDKPSDPERDGYFFKGWAYALDADDEPLLWDFDERAVIEDEDLSLWAAWEKGVLVVYDPDDGKTTYPNFYKTTVKIGEKITDKPSDPERDGYLFKGWAYGFDDNGKVLFWNFDEDVVTEDENLTLWAVWEKGVLVVYDPDDGKTMYPNFYKTTVKIGEKITDKPSDPERDGYLFKGWAYALDADDEPLLWDFDERAVIEDEDLSLWAAWEKGVLVVYDPDDGKTMYPNFYKTTVKIGEKITDKPSDPERDGYLFKGWAYGFDDNGKVLFWNFDEDVVTEDENLTLWAVWEKGVLVVYDPDDGKTIYPNFYKLMVKPGEKITDKPTDPERDGYFFEGWAYGFDDNRRPLFWDFNEDVVLYDEVLTLFAVWTKGQNVVINYIAGTGGSVSRSSETLSSLSGIAQGSIATADVGYTFVNWTKDGTIVSTSKTFVPEKVGGLNVAATYYANYAEINASEMYNVTWKYETGYNTGKYDDRYHIVGEGSPKEIKYYVDLHYDSNYTYTTHNIVVDATSGTAITDSAVTGTTVNIKKVTYMELFYNRNKPTESKPGNKNSSTNVTDKPKVPQVELEKKNHFAYIMGYPDGNVKPLNKITREEVAMIFYRLLTDESREKVLSDTNPFTDLEVHGWSNRAISTLFNAGIISGYTDGSFKPSEPITRAEFAAIAARFDELKSENTTNFADIEGHWAEKYIASSENKGWVNGYPDKTFKPEQHITRAEAITLINNVLKRAVSAENIHTDATFWSDIKVSDWYYKAVMEATNSHEYVYEKDNEQWTGMKTNKIWP